MNSFLIMIYLLTGLGMSWVRNRVSKFLLNSAIAVVSSACLVKGIVEVSGRTRSEERRVGKECKT